MLKVQMSDRILGPVFVLIMEGRGDGEREEQEEGGVRGGWSVHCNEAFGGPREGEKTPRNFNVLQLQSTLAQLYLGEGFFFSMASYYTFLTHQDAFGGNLQNFYVCSITLQGSEH